MLKILLFSRMSEGIEYRAIQLHNIAQIEIGQDFANLFFRESKEREGVKRLSGVGSLVRGQRR